MTPDPPLVSVVIPARNEAADIVGCIEAIAAQDHPIGAIEVICVDGASDDTTPALAREVLGRYGFADVAVVSNPRRNTPSNLNVGLQRAHGAYFCRVDARSRIPPDYISRCVALLDARPEVVAVGGAQVAAARRPTPLEIGIARALNNRYGMGLSRYRRGAASGPSDTVYLGFYRCPQLREIGGWDERFATNQDFDLNQRIAALGVVWFEAGLEVHYLPRRDLRSLFLQYSRFGRWKARYWRATGNRPQPRQLGLILLPIPLALGAVVWFRRRRHPWRDGVPVALALGAAYETAGVSGPSGGPTSRAVSVAASAVVAAGWLTGVYGGVLEGEGPGAG